MNANCEIWIRMIRQESNQHEFDEYKKYWESTGLINNTLDRIYYHNIFDWGGQLESFNGISNNTETLLPCVSLWSLMPIFANGDVPMCNVDYGCNHKIGNIFNSSIKEITLDLSSKLQLKEIQNFLEEKGETIVNINITDGSRISSFKLKNPRYIDRKSINILRNKEISLNIR